ncbi:MAG: hypothetical protein PW734_05935 [Verrucomicrobium sp.]|nr:hypothetical protein [Verrucomicrobium sp.]
MKPRSAPHQALVGLLGRLGVWRAKKQLLRIRHVLLHGKAAMDHLLLLDRRVRELREELDQVRASNLAARGLPYPLRFPEAAEAILDGGAYALDPKADTNALRALAEARAFHGPGHVAYAGKIPPDHQALLEALRGPGEAIVPLDLPHEIPSGGFALLAAYEGAAPAAREALARLAAASPGALCVTAGEAPSFAPRPPLLQAGALCVGAEDGETLRRGLLLLPNYRQDVQGGRPILRRVAGRQLAAHYEA